MFNYINNSYSLIKFFYSIVNTDILKATKEEVNNLKKITQESGVISMKFMQWYISKLISTNNLSKDQETNLSYFEDIFDNCPKHDINESINIFKDNFKSDIKDIVDFDSLEIIASGSIGQVYKAKLLDGRIVAIKVKHPKIEDIKNYQLPILYLLDKIQKTKYFKNKYDLHFELRNFIEDLILQLDFKNEVFNNLKFYKNFKNSDAVIIPKVYYYSNDIIISSYEDGISYKKIDNKYKKKKIALNFHCFNLNTLLVDNFIHGDLHQGNWKIREVDNTQKLIIYDFGICFKSEDRETTKKVWHSFENYNTRDIFDACKYLFQDRNGEFKEEFEDFNQQCNVVLYNEYNTVFMLKSINNYFKEKDLTATKLFMNILIYFMLIDHILLEADIVSNVKGDESKEDYIQMHRSNIIAFCETTNSYPELQEYITKIYKKNSFKNLFNYEGACELEFSDPEDL